MGRKLSIGPFRRNAALLTSAIALLALGGCAPKATESGILVTATSQASGVQSARNLFIDSKQNWVSRRRPYFPESIEFTFPTARPIGEFGFVGAAGRPQSSPGHFTLEMEENGRWLRVLEVTNSCISKSSPRGSWTLPREVKGRHFRFNILKTCGDNEYIILQHLVVEPFRPPGIREQLALGPEHLIFPLRDGSDVLAVSSVHAPGVSADRMIDGNPKTVWHASVDTVATNKVSWVAIDLGANAVPVQALRFTPRPDAPAQFFSVAIVQASIDGEKWLDIAQLKVADQPNDGTPITWRIPNNIAYRHYRVMLPEGFAGGAFYSIAELELYSLEPISAANRPALSRPVSAKPGNRLFPLRDGNDMIVVNSTLGEATGEKLIDGNPGTVWHIDGNAPGRPSVFVSLAPQALRPVNQIRMRARADAPGQFFKTALVEGTYDGSSWSKVATLRVDEAPSKDSNEFLFAFNNETAFPHYRISFPFGFADGRFISAAELELLSTFGNPVVVAKPAAPPPPAAPVVAAPVVAAPPVAAKPPSPPAAAFGPNTAASPSNRIGPAGMQARASSSVASHTGPDKLFDGDAKSVWHIDGAKLGPTRESWVEIRLPEGEHRPLIALKARPRPDEPAQMFRNAVLEGSADGRVWAPIAGLATPAQPQGLDELVWRFDNNKSWPVYRLTMTDGFAQNTFVSMGELELYGAPANANGTKGNRHR